MSRTAIIAGQGALAPALAAHLPDAPVYALAGYAPEMAAVEFRLERLVPFLEMLADQGVERVVFGGAVRRPRLDPEAFDPRTATLVPRIVGAMAQGDDAALRVLLDIFEEFGISIAGIEEIAPDLIPGAGLLAGQPGEGDRRDAERAAAILAATGPLDLGQGCVVVGGLCLALETLPGTAAMLDFAARHREAAPGSGVFYKAPKPGQDRRIDLPALGPDTVAQAARAGLAGIAWQAGGVVVLDRAAMIAAARAAGLFLWARG